MQFTDPTAFEKFLAPLGGEVRIRPMTGSHFRANMEARKLRRVGLFTIEADSFSAQKVPQQEFYGFSSPLNVPFTVSEPGYELTFGRASAHMLSPGRPFNFQCKKKCHVMVCNFFVDSLEAYRESLLQETTDCQRSIEPTVSLMSEAGSGLFRSVIRAWVALGIEDSSVSKIALQEMEDDLLASFIVLGENWQAIEKGPALPADYALRHTEDYICAHLDTAITRDDLADSAGVSIRSLSRAFEKNTEWVPWRLFASVVWMPVIPSYWVQNLTQPQSQTWLCRSGLATLASLQLHTKKPLANRHRQAC